MKGFRKLYVRPNIPVEAARRKKARKEEAEFLAAVRMAQQEATQKKAEEQATTAGPSVSIETVTVPAEDATQP